MLSFDIPALRTHGREALAQAAYKPKKLILLHTGVMVAASVILSVLNHFLAQGIGNTGGLGGIGTRALLETVSSVLQLMDMLLLPFWQIGLVAAMLSVVRGQQARPAALLEGFRNWGPVLRMNILRAFVYFAVILLASQLGSMVYMMTPFAAPLLELTEQMAASGIMDPTQLLTPELTAQLMKSFVPVILAVWLVVLIPVSYRLRMMDYVLMDDPKLGAFFALRMSLFMTRKNCIQLFKLDLRYWWFYALELLAGCICYGDLLLSLMGVELGMGQEMTGFLCVLAGLLCQLGLYVWKKDELTAVYALAYEALLPPPPAETAEV